MKKLLIKIKSKLSKKIIIVIGVIILIFTAFRVYSSQKAIKMAQKETVKKGSVSSELILSGEITAVEYANLAFPTSGKITWVGVTEGNWVKKGQALTSLDKTTLNAALRQAQNNVRMYEASVASTYDSLKDKASSETFAERSTRTTAEVAKDNAYDSLRAAEYNLTNSTLIAPFEGLITYLAHPYSGVNIIATETQVVLLNPNTIYFEVTADQSEVIDIVADQKVVIVLDSYSDKEFLGKVSFIGQTPKENESGTVYKVKVNFDEKSFEGLKIGMTGDAKFILETKESILFLPSQFIHVDTKGKYVKIGSLKNKTYIQTGIENEDKTEIVSGVNEGDIVYE